MPDVQGQGLKQELMDWFERQPGDRKKRIRYLAAATGLALVEALFMLKQVSDLERRGRAHLRLVTSARRTVSGFDESLARREKV